MHKKGARSRKILLPPLADIVNTLQKDKIS